LTLPPLKECRTVSPEYPILVFIFSTALPAKQEFLIIHDLLPKNILRDLEKIYNETALIIRGQSGILSVLITPPHRKFVKPNYISMHDNPLIGTGVDKNREIELTRIVLIKHIQELPCPRRQQLKPQMSHLSPR
jgi:hypothetical protein